jgi:hypothetical protein
MAEPKDNKGTVITVGAKAYYRPDMDHTEQMFGTVPDEYNGDVCQVVKTYNTPGAVRVEFEGGTTEDVRSNALLLIAAAPAAPAAPAPATT